MKHRWIAAIVMVCSLSPVWMHGQAQAPTPPQEEPRPAMSVPQNYRFDPRGRRDPFINPVPPRVEARREPEVPVSRPPGLRGVMISEAKVVGVVASSENSMNMAVIVAPGNRTFFAAPGEALYDGVVKQVRRDAVVFAITRAGGDQTGREIVRKVRTTSGEPQ